MSEQICAIRIRGEIGIRKDIKDTLKMLNLTKKHACITLKKSDINIGMLRKAKDYITWGEISPEIAEALSKRSEKGLHPPRGGFERKGIKVAFAAGGALGYRGAKMDDLIKRMI